MDGENIGKPYFLMDDLGVPLFLETPICKPDIPPWKRRNEDCWKIHHEWVDVFPIKN